MKTILFITWITSGGWFSSPTTDIHTVEFTSRTTCEKVAEEYNLEAKTKFPDNIKLHAVCVEEQEI